MRVFDQRANVPSAMADRDRVAQRPRMGERHEHLAKEARDHANALRKLLMAEQE